MAGRLLSLGHATATPQGAGRVQQLRRIAATAVRHTDAHAGPLSTATPPWPAVTPLLTSTTDGGLRFASSSNFLCAAHPRSPTDGGPFVISEFLLVISYVGHGWSSGSGHTLVAGSPPSRTPSVHPALSEGVLLSARHRLYACLAS